MVPAAPYGTWPSPIAPADLAGGGVKLSEVRADGDTLYWIERRPLEGGRNALVRRSASGLVTDVLTERWSARSKVHEYGGGSYAVLDDTVVFVNSDDQCLYLVEPRGTPAALTAPPVTPRSVRFADLHFDPAGQYVVAVRETHDGPDVRNDLVAVWLEGPDRGALSVLATGHDFYASPRLTADGDRLAWLTWDHPRMPWDGTELWVADVAGAAEGGPVELTDARVVAGGPEESVVQPEWLDDRLHFVSDRSGWWNIYRSGDTEPVGARDAEFAGPQWVFGLTWYAGLPDGRIAAAVNERGLWRLGVIDADRRWTDLDTPLTDISYVGAWGDHVVCIGGGPTEAPAVVVIDPDSGAMRTLRQPAEPVHPGYVSRPEAIDFPTTGGGVAHAFFYAPANKDVLGPREERPPLIVTSHGGPTSAARAVYDIAVQFWTSRGFAVVDVNYRGSTGFGRAYRDALRGAWGVADADDCVAAARHLVATGRVDGDRLAIRGGSAGGYTTLRVLTTTTDFAVAACYYGVADAEALARDTHKFEARYLDSLIGPYPQRREIYVERSPVHVAGRITAPLIVFQGLDDAVVPPSQSEAIVDAVRDAGVPVAYLPFAGEGHGFRQASTIIRCAEAELWFYGRILGLAPAGNVPPVPVDNLR